MKRKKKLALKIGDDNYVLWHAMYCILNFYNQSVNNLDLLNMIHFYLYSEFYNISNFIHFEGTYTGNLNFRQWNEI